MGNKTYEIAVIRGDGIGPEVIYETIKVLKAVGFNFNIHEAYAGFGAYEKFGKPLPDETVETCKNVDAVLFGAVTTPPNIEGYKSPIVQLRKMFNLYANVRPFHNLPTDTSGKKVDIVVVRENTEDLYVGKERHIDGGAVTERVITDDASIRIVTYAFELALQQNRSKVTIVHKANVLRMTDGIFLSRAQEVAANYPDIQSEDMLVDACAMKLVMKPEYFDVIVTTNMFGDILSDEIAGLVGGLGIAASANISEKLGLFEPVHGSAPKYTGMNRANPMATLYAACMMLDYLGEAETAGKIRTAISKTLTEGKKTHDLGGELGTKEFTEAVIKNL